MNLNSVPLPEKKTRSLRKDFNVLELHCRRRCWAGWYNKSEPWLRVSNVSGFFFVFRKVSLIQLTSPVSNRIREIWIECSRLRGSFRPFAKFNSHSSKERESRPNTMSRRADVPTHAHYNISRWLKFGRRSGIVAAKSPWKNERRNTLRLIFCFWFCGFFFGRRVCRIFRSIRRFDSNKCFRINNTRSADSSFFRFFPLVSG